MRLFKIKTFGCKVNQYEEQAMREALLSDGHKEAEDGQGADLCIVNTCTVTARADKDSREATRRYLRENPFAEVVVAGCYSEADAKTIKAIDERIRVIGNKEKLTGVIPAEAGIQARDSRLGGNDKETKGISNFKNHDRAFIKVQDGCDNFCAYCIVPYVRGNSRSRDPQEIIEEAKRLIGSGYKELVLTGVCLGSFGRDLKTEIDLTSLVKKIADIEGDFRIRLSSIELPDVGDALLDEMFDSPKLCHHLHIPLQSGDDEILKAMNRKYNSSGFLSRIGHIRSKIPGIAITTDVVVGFPHETEPHFNMTVETLRKLRPSRTHIFTYSPRKGTKAFDLGDIIPAKVKSERARLLRQITDSLAKKFGQSSSENKQRVLIENTRDKKTGKLTGYTDTYVKILLDGTDELKGTFVYC